MQIGQRIKESLTWRSIIYFVSGTAISLFPDHLAQITSIGFCLSGIVGVLFSDTPVKDMPMEVPKVSK